MLVKKSEIKSQFRQKSYKSKIATEILRNNGFNVVHKALFNQLLEIFKPLAKQLKVEEDFKKTLQPLKNLMQYLYDNRNTITGYYVKFRNLIRRELGLIGKKWESDKRVLWTFNPYFGDPDLTKAINKDKKIEKKDRLDPSKMMKVPLSKVLNVISDNIESDDWGNRFVAAQLAVHSRNIEIIKISDFRKIQGDNEHIKVIGVAKESKFSKSNEKKVIKKRLVGCNTNQFLNAVDFIRNENSEKLEKWGDNLPQLGNSFAGVLKRRSKLLMGVLPHSLRAIGANASFVLYARKGTDRIPYLQSVLGHSSSETSKWYAQYVVVNDLSKEQISDVREDNIIENPIPELETLNLNNRVEKVEIKVDEIKREIDDIEYPELKNSRAFSDDVKISNIKQLISKGITTYRKLKLYGYGSRIIKRAKSQ